MALQKYMTSLLAVVVNFSLSAFGSFLLFRLLHSSAIVTGARYEAGGALAGFILLYWMLHRSFCKLLTLQEPCLTPRQTLDMIHLFHESVKSRILRTVFGWVDDVEAGCELPPLETRLQVVDTTRHEPRQYIIGFTTPLQDFYRYVEEKGESKLFRDSVMEAMELIESKTMLPAEKRKALQELADSVQRAHYNEYVRDLAKVGRLWRGSVKRKAEPEDAVDG